MTERAALLVDEVLPREPLRQLVLGGPFALRYLFVTDPALMSQVLGIVYQVISSHFISAAGYHHATAQTDAGTLIRRFGSAELKRLLNNYCARYVFHWPANVCAGSDFARASPR